jgi:hypothetical protein
VIISVVIAIAIGIYNMQTITVELSLYDTFCFVYDTDIPADSKVQRHLKLKNKWTKIQCPFPRKWAKRLQQIISKTIIT